MSLVIGLVAAVVLGAAGAEGPTAARVREAAARGLNLIEASTKQYPRHRECFSCHHQAVPVLALALARDRGFAVDEANLHAQLQLTRDDLEGASEDYRAGRGQGGGVTRAGYALLTLEAGGWKPDETTAAVAGYLSGRDQGRDHWRGSSRRPPSEASDFTATYVAIAGLGAFATPGQRKGATDRVDRAKAWLAKSKGVDTEDRVFRLLGLKAAKADDATIREASEELRSTQRDDGGWSQLPGGEPDAYATGSALTALRQAAKFSTEDACYRRGLRFLLKTQKPDGSWHVVSRSQPFQTYFESGFPHGKDQFISIAASAWATSALLLALPEAKPSVRTGDDAEPPASPVAVPPE